MQKDFAARFLFLVEKPCCEVPACFFRFFHFSDNAAQNIAWHSCGRFRRLCDACKGCRPGFDEMYGPASVLGITFPDKLKSLNGKLTSVRGFMAPPLKADAKFLVLTRSPVNLCPFCNSDEDWPDSIIVVYLKNPGDFVQANKAIEVTGTLELGSATDEETGFVSLVRLVDASFSIIDI